MGQIINQSLSDKLSSYTDKRYHFLTGRGTTGIFLLSQLLFEENSKVIVSPIICPHVIYGLLLADITPVFCDIDLETFNLSFDEVDKILKKDKTIKGIVLAEVFGYPLDKRFYELNNKGIEIIYDRAQSIGNKNKLNFFKAHELHSFGYSKPIDINDGGAIATNNLVIFEELKRAEASLSEIDEKEIEKCEADYRADYYNLVGKTDAFYIDTLYHKYKDSLLYKEDINQNSLLESLSKLESNNRIRVDNTLGLLKYLMKNKIEHPKLSDDIAPWRYTFLVPKEKQQQIIQSLRKENYHVSSWYPSCAYWFQNAIIFGSLDNANYFTERVVNLWVDSSIDNDYLIGVSVLINNILDNN